MKPAKHTTLPILCTTIAILCNIIVSSTSSSPGTHNFRIKRFTTTSNPQYGWSSASYNQSIQNFSYKCQRTFDQLRLMFEINGLTRYYATDPRYRIGVARRNPMEYSNFINQSIDFCEFLRTPKRHPLINLVWNEFLNNSNSNMRGVQCPMQPGHYYARDYHVSIDKYPRLLPDMQVKFIFKLLGFDSAIGDFGFMVEYTTIGTLVKATYRRKVQNSRMRDM